MANGYILIVDDEPDIRHLLKEILEDEGYQVGLAENAAAARRARAARRPDLVLLDIWMPDEDGISLLKEWHEAGGDPCPVIMMSGHGTVETAVEATRHGAYDFIEKPLSLAKLLVTVQRALEARALAQENSGLRRQVQPVFEPVGRSEVMQRLRGQVLRIAAHDTPVLLAGPAGGGKGVFARYIHHSGPRARGPFVEVSVASLQENPAAELFGHEEGGVHYGLLEQASGGTLLLDDVADLDLSLQARLLGALESGTFLRVGGNSPVHTDLHLIAASRYNLDQLVGEGRLRKELYYLLNVYPLHIPPLREHAEDVPDLLNYYVDHFVRTDKLPYRTFSVAAQNRLRNHPWPGNVRELKNLVQRLLIASAEPVIEMKEVEAALGLDLPDLGGGPIPVSYSLPLREARERFEQDYFEHLLKEYSGSVNRVAQHAGVERTHLYRKLRSLGLDPKQFSD